MLEALQQDMRYALRGPGSNPVFREFIAALFPAMRAARFNPMAALREE